MGIRVWVPGLFGLAIIGMGCQSDSTINVAPTARFFADPVSGPVPLTVEFAATLSSDDGTIDSFNWDFDGATGSGSIASQVFKAPGSYTVTLTVIDDRGATATDKTTIDVFAPAPMAAISFANLVVDSEPPPQTHTKATGDIDGDGFEDVIVGTGHSGHGLFWYRYPDWTRHQIWPSGTGFTTDMHAADVDGDGDIDVIVPKGFYKGDSVWWYENPLPTGDPALNPWIEHFIGDAGSHDLEIGDVNNDGKIDVVTRRTATTLFLQGSRDSWTPVVISTRGEEGLSLGDLDGDNDLDVAINGYWLENPILPVGGPEASPWVEHVIDARLPLQMSSHIADVNADGRNDVILGPAESAGEPLSWYEGPLDARNDIWPRHIINNSAEFLHTFKTADIDNNGTLDLVTAEMNQSADPDLVSVYFHDGTGLYWAQQVVSNNGSHNFRLTDFDNDGDIDIMGANWDGNSPVEIWRNDLIVQSDAVCGDRIVDDPEFCDDGNTVGGDNCPANCLNPLSVHNWERHLIDGAVPWRMTFVSPADIDGDLDLDIVTGGWWYENPGDIAGVWARHTVGESMNNMAWVYDFDGDGDQDILGTDGKVRGQDYYWARNGGSGVFSVQRIGAPTAVFSKLPGGDFLQGAAGVPANDGGAYRVVLSWNGGERGISGIESLSVPADPWTQAWTQEVISKVSLGEGLSAGDIDGDGDYDVFQGSMWLRNDGGNWTQFKIQSIDKNTLGQVDRVRLADLDSDGDLDAAIGFGHMPKGGTRLVWLEHPDNPTETWPLHTIEADIADGYSVNVADIDNDGDIDVIHGNHREFTTGAVRVFENTGRGDTWRSQLIDPGAPGIIDHHNGVRAVDLDGDGDLDLISIGWFNQKAWVFENKAIDRS